VRPELGHWKQADLRSGFEILPGSPGFGSLFFVFCEFFGELGPPVSGEMLRDPALRRLIRKLDSISLRLTPRERFVCRMRLQSSDEQKIRAVAGAAMRLIMSPQSQL